MNEIFETYYAVHHYAKTVLKLSEICAHIFITLKHNLKHIVTT